MALSLLIREVIYVLSTFLSLFKLAPWKNGIPKLFSLFKLNKSFACLDRLTK